MQLKTINIRYLLPVENLKINYSSHIFQLKINEKQNLRNKTRSKKKKGIRRRRILIKLMHAHTR